MREAAADLSHPVSAHRSWRQLSRDARKGAGCSTPLRMCNGGEPGCRSPPAFRGTGCRGFSRGLPPRAAKAGQFRLAMASVHGSLRQRKPSRNIQPIRRSKAQGSPFAPSGPAERRAGRRHPGASCMAGPSTREQMREAAPGGTGGRGPPPFWRAKRGPDVPAPFQHVRVVRWRDPPHTGW